MAKEVDSSAADGSDAQGAALGAVADTRAAGEAAEAVEEEDVEIMGIRAQDGDAHELLRLREHCKLRDGGDGGSFTSTRRSSRCYEAEDMSAQTRRRWILFSIIGGLIYGYNVRCACTRAVVVAV